MFSSKQKRLLSITKDIKLTENEWTKLGWKMSIFYKNYRIIPKIERSYYLANFDMEFLLPNF